MELFIPLVNMEDVSLFMNKKYKYLIIVFLIVTSFAALAGIVSNNFVNFRRYRLYH